MRGWAIERNGKLVPGVLACSHRAVWWEFVARINGERPIDAYAYQDWIKRQKRAGYRAIRVTVTPAPSHNRRGPQPRNGRGRG